MLLVGSTAAAYPLMLGAMIFLGTWPNGFKLCASVRVEQLYLSFAIGFLLVGIGGPLIFGDVGLTKPNFISELTALNGIRVLFALLGGVILSCGNELYCFGSAHVGMTVALFLQGGLGILLGSAINYLIDPSGANPGFLFGGVGISFLAVIFSTFASISRDRYFERVRTRELAATQCTPMIVTASVDAPATTLYAETHGMSEISCARIEAEDNVKVSTMSVDMHDHTTESALSAGKSTFRGVSLSVLCGLFTAIFSPLFNLSTSKSITIPPGSSPLSTWTAFFFFAIAFATTSWALNLTILSLDKTMTCSASAFSSWTALPRSVHVVSVACGILCGIANIFLFLGGAQVGFAASLGIALV